MYKRQHYYNSDYTSVTNGLLSYGDKNAVSTNADVVLELGSIQNIPEYKQIPIFIVPQTLLFTELTLEAGEVKVFHFRTARLPKELVPTYLNSQNISINYSLEFGVSKITSETMNPYLVKVPITVSPFVDSSGCQFMATLNKKPFILKPGSVKQLKKTHSNKRKVSTASTVSFGRRNSSIVDSQETNELVEKAKQNFIKLVKSNQNGSKHIEELVDLQLQVQFPPLDDTSDNDSSYLNKDGVEFVSSKETSHYSVRDTISLLREMSSTGMVKEGNDAKPDDATLPILQQQLTNLQKNYLINRNGEQIAKLTFSKEFFTISEDIDLMLSFSKDSPTSRKVTAVTVTLESFESINSKFIIDSMDKHGVPKVTAIYESHHICFDECSSLPVKLLVPKSPMNQLSSQFKTDVFQLKYMLLFKFVLADRSKNVALEQFYEDKKGTLFHSKESLEGESFSCRVPVVVLPTIHDMGGW